MRVSFWGLDLPRTKIQYNDRRLRGLREQIDPDEVVSYYVDLVKGDFEHSDAILVSYDKAKEFFSLDIARFSKYEHTDNIVQNALVKRCLSSLSLFTPLCDMDFSVKERGMLQKIALVSLKPTVIVTPLSDPGFVLEQLIRKAGVHFFYTYHKKKIRAWAFKTGATIDTCAGKIHSDMAKNFIKAEVISFDHIMQVHSMAEAKKLGFVKNVSLGYVVQDGDIIDIKF